MGLFGWGKKKNEPANATDEVFARFGEQTNQPVTPQKQTRRDAVAAAEEARQADAKKERLLEAMTVLRKKLYTMDGFDRFLDRLEDAYQKLKAMPDNQNKKAMASVDGFILKALNMGMDHANRASRVGMSACLDVIEQLVNDRFNCGVWYEDPKYVECRLTADNLYVEIKMLEERVKKINVSGAALAEDYKNPALKAEHSSILSEMMSLKQEREKLEVRIRDAREKEALLKNMMNQIEVAASNRATQESFDIMDQFNDVREMQMENDSQTSQISRMNEQMNQSRVKHTESNLSIDGSVEEEGTSAPQVDVSNWF